MATSTINYPMETNAGIVTSWIPLTTPFVAPRDCFSTFWARWGFIQDQNYDAVAFDPSYDGISFDGKLSCLPPQVELWWERVSISAVGITEVYSIGPIVCPQQYTTAATSNLNAGSTIVACCPSDYTFVAIAPPGSVGECTSPLSQGATLTYLMESTPGNTAGGIMTTSTTMTAPYFVIAVPVNGVNYNAPSASPMTTDLGAIIRSIFEETSTAVSGLTSVPASLPLISTPWPPLLEPNSSLATFTQSLTSEENSIASNLHNSLASQPLISSSRPTESGRASPPIHPSSTSISSTSTQSSPPPLPPSNTLPSPTLSFGARIGIGTGIGLGVIGLVGILALVILSRRKRRKNSKQQLVESPKDEAFQAGRPEWKAELSNTVRSSELPTEMDTHTRFQVHEMAG